MTFNKDNVIYSYSRADALADGLLVEVTSTARALGFRFPVDLTSSVWSMIETIPENSGEDAIGRLWDLLTVLLTTIRARIQKSDADFDTLHFSLLITNATTKEQELVQLKAVCGPGDNHEPIVTIMLPEED